MTVSAEEIAAWRGWIGREETRSERVDPEAVRRYAAALGESVDVEAELPSLAHWACFLPAVAADAIGPDGHPKRGGFLPPITLPRRMFAAAEMEFHAPLMLGEIASRTSIIVDVQHKTGRSGELVLVHVEHRIDCDGALAIVERQTLVYRDAGDPTPPVIARGEAVDGEAWRPGPVELFRFSAATFNSHRIHYDLPYATGEEGYPGLVVHGPFTAARLHGIAAREASPGRFSFRAQAPLFVGQPIGLLRDGETMSAVRCDGVVAMAASAQWPSRD